MPWMFKRNKSSLMTTIATIAIIAICLGSILAVSFFSSFGSTPRVINREQRDTSNGEKATVLERDIAVSSYNAEPKKCPFKSDNTPCSSKSVANHSVPTNGVDSSPTAKVQGKCPFGFGKKTSNLGKKENSVVKAKDELDDSLGGEKVQNPDNITTTTTITDSYSNVEADKIKRTKSKKHHKALKKHSSHKRAKKRKRNTKSEKGTNSKLGGLKKKQRQDSTGNSKDKKHLRFKSKVEYIPTNSWEREPRRQSPKPKVTTFTNNKKKTGIARLAKDSLIRKRPNTLKSVKK